MKLLIVVVNRTEFVPDIISTLVELNVRGVVVLESESIIQFLAQEVSIFIGLRDLIQPKRSFNKTILALTDNHNILEDLYNMLKRIRIDLKAPGMGYATTITIDEIIESPEE